MKLKYKDTELNIIIHETKNRVGLDKDDVWCEMSFIAVNKNFHHEVWRKSLTKSETLSSIERMKNYYYKGKLEDNMTFIKNYFTVNFYPIIDGKKIMEIFTITILNGKTIKHVIKFEDKEIAEFIEMVEKNYKIK